MTTDNSSIMNTHVYKNIVLTDTISEGNFGEIFLGECSISGEQYAIKVSKKKKQLQCPYLMKEFKIMRDLSGKGLFPTSSLIPHENSNIGKEVLLMQKLGPSILDIYEMSGRDFSFETIVKLMQDVILRLKEFHSCGYVHRDIKPDNFCVGSDDQSKIYLIDFGLSDRFVDTQYDHIPLEFNRGFVGTPVYASSNSHRGRRHSRRDDLEAAGYLGLFLLHGKLPWQDIKAEGGNKKEHEKLFNLKKKLPFEEFDSHVPYEFQLYLQKVKSLRFEEKPDYDELLAYFKKLELQHGHQKQYFWETDEELQRLFANNDLVIDQRDTFDPEHTSQEFTKLSKEDNHDFDIIGANRDFISHDCPIVEY